MLLVTTKENLSQILVTAGLDAEVVDRLSRLIAESLSDLDSILISIERGLAEGLYELLTEEILGKLLEKLNSKDRENFFGPVDKQIERLNGLLAKKLGERAQNADFVRDASIRSILNAEYGYEIAKSRYFVLTPDMRIS